MSGAYSADDLMLDQPDEGGGEEEPQPPRISIEAAQRSFDAAKPVAPAAGKSPAYVDEPDTTFADEPDPDAPKPGWPELAWHVIKGAAANAPLLPLLKSIYDETTSEISKMGTEAQQGHYLSAARHGLAATPVSTVPTAVGTMLSNLPAEHLDQIQKFRSAFERGRETGDWKFYSEAVGHLAAAAVPMVGPGAANLAEAGVKAYEADDPNAMAEAVGGGAAQVAGWAVPGVVRGGRATAAETVAPMVERHAERVIAREISPHVYANKGRMGNIAAEAAPRLVREPGMNAFSTATYGEKVNTRTEAALQELNTAYDTAPRRTYAIAPVVKRINDKIAKLTPIGESGEAVEPMNRAARLAALKAARAEVQKLGKSADVAALRDLRIAWDEGAKKEFTPSIQQDFLKTRAEGAGWADARGALADYLGEQLPQTRPLNAEYSFWRGVNDVMAAMEESERTRPNRMSKGVTGFLGGAEGMHLFGPLGAVIGAVMIPVVDIAMTSGVTTKIASARAMARLADALRTGDIASQTSALRALAATTGQGKQLDEALRRARGETPQQP